MISNVFKYLKSNCPPQPKLVDRLIISAYFSINKIKAEKNAFIKDYLINESNKPESKALITLINVIKVEMPEFKIEELIELFEFVISPADKLVNGAVYTPDKIREFITQNVFELKVESINKIKIADIACGCGGFLYNSALLLKKKTRKSYYEIFSKHLWGLDIQSYSITRAKLLLTTLALSEGEDKSIFKFNLFVGDALTYQWRNIKFDIIVGNPPYVCSRHLSESVKKKLARWEVCASGHPDLYIPFFQIGIENLKKGGVLGFITMNSFFKSLNARSLRNYFQHSSLHIKIVDFGTTQIFKTKHTYTCICIIENKKSNRILYRKTTNDELVSNDVKDFAHINYNNLNAKNGWNLNEHTIISKIEGTGKPLGELFKTRNGIATLKNEVYIFSPVKEDKDFFYLNDSSGVYPIEKEICKDILNSNKIRSSKNISQLKEKIIFPYTNDTKPLLIDESLFKEKYPATYRYLEAKKILLSTRDRGKGNYEKWYAFGRSQSLEKEKFKLFFPHLSDQVPNTAISTDEDLLFYNGLALVGTTKKDLLFMQKIMESDLFWFYIQHTSKPYSSNYLSLSSNYIRNFGIFDFSEDDITYIIKETNKKKLNSFFRKKYLIDFILPNTNSKTINNS